MPTLFIEEDLLSEFRVEVLRRHGKLYGSLRDEAAQAIRDHTAKLRRENDRLVNEGARSGARARA